MAAERLSMRKGTVTWARGRQNRLMQTKEISYRSYRFPREISSHGVWLYHRFALSFRNVEGLLAKRGATVVTYKTVRLAGA